MQYQIAQDRKSRNGSTHGKRSIMDRECWPRRWPRERLSSALFFCTGSLIMLIHQLPSCSSYSSELQPPLQQNAQGEGGALECNTSSGGAADIPSSIPLSGDSGGTQDHFSSLTGEGYANDPGTLGGDPWSSVPGHRNPELHGRGGHS